MGLLDPAIRRATRLSLCLAGSLILEVRRRGQPKPRRTPDHLLLEDRSGLPGPALVEPVADFDRLLMPPEIDRLQAKELTQAAGQTALDGALERMREAARRLSRNVRDIPRPLASASRSPDRSDDDDGTVASLAHPAERAAWERFVAALEKVNKLRAAHELRPDDLTADHLRSAEVDLEDAVAVAGEFEVRNIRWMLA
jgi:hypothetical protein